MLTWRIATSAPLSSQWCSQAPTSCWMCSPKQRWSLHIQGRDPSRHRYRAWRSDEVRFCGQLYLHAIPEGWNGCCLVELWQAWHDYHTYMVKTSCCLILLRGTFVTPESHPTMTVVDPVRERCDHFGQHRKVNLWGGVCENTLLEHSLKKNRDNL